MGRVRTVSDLRPDEVAGRRFLVRVDFNVPLSEGGEITDSTRVDATLPTLEALRSRGASMVLVSHLGRPKGAPDPRLSLAPVAALLSERLGVDVPLAAGDPVGAEVAEAARALGSGDVLLLENIRFNVGETTNDPGLAEGLARLADGFVADAFGTAHRAHASTVGAAAAVRANGGPVVAGLLVEREVHFLRESLRDPGRPFVAVMGGAKISGKIELIRGILPRVDRLLVGGAMANTFLRAMGLDTGASLVEGDLTDLAAELLAEAGEKLVLPVDAVVAEEISADAETTNVDRTEVSGSLRIGDIGLRSRAVFTAELERARTVVWNGPMGVFEIEPFAGGTLHIAQALAGVARGGASVIVGGGDSAAAALAAGVAHEMTHISTGGGAALDLLAGHSLPGVDILDTVEA